MVFFRIAPRSAYRRIRITITATFPDARAHPARVGNFINDGPRIDHRGNREDRDDNSYALSRHEGSGGRHYGGTEMIALTREDWAEIYYALETKALALRQGRYEPEDTPGEDAQWLAHIDALREKVGPDGITAARDGVTPTK